MGEQAKTWMLGRWDDRISGVGIMSDGIRIAAAFYCGGTQAAHDHARLIAAAPELLAACKAQHTAIDTLLALLITRDATFMPTKSAEWPACVQAAAAIAKATGAGS